jgi:hypothetical protein
MLIIAFGEGARKAMGDAVALSGVVIVVLWICVSIFGACYIVDWSMGIPWSAAKRRARQRAYEDNVEIWNRTVFCHHCSQTFVI